jgi:hypothetical protein
MGAAMSDYREKAEECVRTAQKMRNAAERIEMLGIARNYIALADHAGRRLAANKEALTVATGP